MTKFIEETYYDFIISDCVVNHIDCRGAWKLTPTYRGMCMQFDPYDALNNKKGESHRLVPIRILKVTQNPIHLRLIYRINNLYPS